MITPPSTADPHGGTRSVILWSILASASVSLSPFMQTAPNESAISERILGHHDPPHPQLQTPMGEPEV